MINLSYTFECITPCFCAGADQTKAEIRPSAIRGALRWWFRCLGGTAEQEAEVFGGSDPVSSSSILVRISAIARVQAVKLPTQMKNVQLSYILYYPSVAAEGARWNVNACYGVGTTFKLHIRQSRAISAEAEAMLSGTILAFRHFGSIGMHVTRGLGAIQCSSMDAESYKQAVELITRKGFIYRQSNNTHEKMGAALTEAGAWLMKERCENFGAGGVNKQPTATALGSTPKPDSELRRKNWSQVPRQTSAVYLRPIKQNNGLRLVAFEAPHGRVLGAASKNAHKEPILKQQSHQH